MTINGTVYLRRVIRRGFKKHCGCYFEVCCGES